MVSGARSSAAFVGSLAFGRVGLALAAGLVLLAGAAPERAKAQSLVDVCTGLSVTLPSLSPVATVSSGLLAGLLDPVLNGIVGDINTNIQSVLSGSQIGLSVTDTGGNPLSFPTDACNLQADGLTLTPDQGITLGGGRIDGLGGTANSAASAGEINSIAIGNGAATTAGALNSVAIGLSAGTSATDAVAMGRAASATAVGGVALGSDSVASRSGLAGGTEDFSGTAVASTNGAVSVGVAGGERQITNVAGGTADTDAVNVRQLRSVGSNLATAIGGGATFNAATGLFTNPSFTIRGTVYNDVGSALAALDVALPVAANNTSAFAAPTAAGADALTVGFGASAGGASAVAVGTGATAAAPTLRPSAPARLRRPRRRRQSGKAPPPASPARPPSV